MDTSRPGMIERMEGTVIALSVRGGLVMAIPILLLGSFSLILRDLPITVYQEFITGFSKGAFYDIFSFINHATFGLLSVYITLSISACLTQSYGSHPISFYTAPMIAMACFGIMSGVLSEGFDIASFGASGMFTAVFSAVGATYLYLLLIERFYDQFRIYADSADVEFTEAVSVTIPAFAVVAVFAVFNHLLVAVFHLSSFTDLIVNGANGIFHNMGRTLFSACLFTLLSSLLWFFGVHGSDVLDGVAQSLFTPILEVGANPSELISKTFLDSFSVMGGCGTSLCLLAAVLLFGKSVGNRRLARIAIFPMAFNINEIMIFGFPVVFNPVLFIPFITVPLVCLLISYVAMASGLVPAPSAEVSWITPVFLSGYLVTGSVWGAVLQLANLVVGTLIYRPFIIAYDEKNLRAGKRSLCRLIDLLKEAEDNKQDITLKNLSGPAGNIAKMLASDLREAIAQRDFQIFYQVQFDQRSCIGVEALLRWNHSQFGMIYPPLVIKLADELGELEALEKSILLKVTEDIGAIHERLGRDTKVSVNVSGGTIQSPTFEAFLRQLMEDGTIQKGEIWLEITEQMALLSGRNAEEMFARIRGMGYPMIIDDFSMGHTSLKYLQSNQFDMVKLDGALVRDMQGNPRCKDIIASIVYLSQSLGFSVLAEYVETEAQKLELEEVGCHMYQGYLFAPAKPLEELKG